MREVLQGQEILELRGMCFNDCGALRLELPQPCHGTLKPVDAGERVNVAVGHDAEAGASGSERDEPDPIADAHEMVGALPAQARCDSCPPRRVARPVVDADPRAHAPPCGVGAVSARADQPELSFEQPRPATGVDHPARRDLVGPAGSGQRHAMRTARAEHNRSDAAAIEHRDADLGVGAEQHVLQPPAIELKRRHRREIRRTELDAVRDVPVPVAGEEVAQPELFELLGAKVRLETQSLLEIVCADLDARFTDLERRLGNGMRPLLDDQDPQRRRFLAQLPRETSAGEPAAEDDDVVMIRVAVLFHRTNILTGQR
jgi:hypothetical protein